MTFGILCAITSIAYATFVLAVSLYELIYISYFSFIQMQIIAFLTILYINPLTLI